MTLYFTGHVRSASNAGGEGHDGPSAAAPGRGKTALLSAPQLAALAAPTEPYHPVLNPTLADALALWLPGGQPASLSLRRALATAPCAGMGARHVGVRRYRAQANALIRAGLLVAERQSDFGAVLYRPARCIVSGPDTAATSSTSAAATAPAASSSSAALPLSSPDADRIPLKNNFAVVPASLAERRAASDSAPTVPARPLSGAAAAAAMGRAFQIHRVADDAQRLRICSQCGQSATVTPREAGGAERRCTNRACGWCAILDDCGREVA